MQKRDLREAMIFLQQYGINMNLAVKIYNKYGGEIYSVLKEIRTAWRMISTELVLKLQMR